MAYTGDTHVFAMLSCIKARVTFLPYKRRVDQMNYQTTLPQLTMNSCCDRFYSGIGHFK